MNRPSGADPNRPRAEPPEDAERHQEIARCLFRESNDALFLFDTADHRVLDVNPAALRLTAFTRDQCKAMRLWDLFSGDSPAHLERVIEAYRRTGFYHSREGFALARRTGESIPVNLSVSRIHTLPSPLGLIVARDVSERKRAEAALRESEARYRGLVETARVIFWSLSPEGRIASLNPQFASVTGWTCEAWVDRPLADLIVPEDRPACAEWIAKVRPGDPPAPAELRVAMRSGSWRVLEFLVTAVGAEGPSGIARDVTEAIRVAEANKRAEDSERAKVAAETANRVKSAFLAQFSHEIRTPLTAILGLTDVALTDPGVASIPPERREDLEIIRRSGNHLLALVNDILDLSEVEAGRLRIAPQPVSPRAVADEVVAELAVRAHERGVSLGVESDPDAPASVVTDPVRFRQILINLVSNAIKFTDRGGVTLRLSAATLDGAPAVGIDVADTGIGLSADQLSHLFEPFYRPSAHASSGSGLGLAISRRLAEALGGRIGVESFPGRGSTFRIKLPALPSGAEIPPPVPKAATASASLVRSAEIPPGLRLLLAEDNGAIRRVATLLLERVGASVAIARNGQEALDAVRAAGEAGEPFDVVLMDMQMPVMDGYEATRQLRADGFPGLIVALTAYAMLEDREECLRIGCDEHLSKPIDFLRLVSIIADGVARPPRADQP